MSSTIAPGTSASTRTKPSVPLPPTTLRPRAGHVEHRQLARWQAYATIIVWLLILSIPFLWIRGGALQDLTTTWGTAISSLGSLFGLIASMMFLLQVLLLARVPVFEIGFGRDGMIKAHKVIGMWSFYALLGHLVFLYFGYQMSTRVFDPDLGIYRGRSFGEMIGMFNAMGPSIAMAAVGTVLIVVPVILLSLKKIRSKMRYEVWHLWHMFSYIGILAALPHQVFAGPSFMANQDLEFDWAAFYWFGIYVAAFACTAIYRVFLPLYRSHKYQVTVESVVPDGARGIDLRLTGKNLDKLGVRGGQFFTWRFLGSKGWVRGHPFSISTAPTATSMSVAIRVVGDGTERIAGLEPGTKVLFEGPYGRVTGDMRTGNRLLMFGAGAGVGPMISILQEQQWAPGEAILFTREPVEADTMMDADIRNLVNLRGLDHRPMFGGIPRGGSTWLAPDEDGMAGDGVELILELTNNNDGDTDIYMCGPPPWMASVIRDLRKAGIPADKIHAEEFSF